jgi:hypothetical protein
MRLSSSSEGLDAQKDLADFSKWILDVGEGNIEVVAKEEETEASWIRIPEDLLLMTKDDKLSCIVDSIYPDLQIHYRNEAYLRERAILTPTNDVAAAVNDHIVSLLPETQKEYLSADGISKSTGATNLIIYYILLNS